MKNQQSPIQATWKSEMITLLNNLRTVAMSRRSIGRSPGVFAVCDRKGEEGGGEGEGGRGREREMGMGGRDGGGEGGEGGAE